jgi:hypothetical protein
VLPDDYTKTITNERFLISNSNEVKLGCVFSSRDQLICLSGSSSWFSDGTFKSSPREFLQNYIIHGCYQNKSTLPCVFSFLPEKSRQAYRHLFNCMKLAAEEYKIELKPVHHIHRIILRIFHNFFKPIKFMHTFSFHAFFQKNSASADIFLCSHKLI